MKPMGRSHVQPWIDSYILEYNAVAYGADSHAWWASGQNYRPVERIGTFIPAGRFSARTGFVLGDCLVPHKTYRCISRRRRHGRCSTASFPGVDERGDEGFPCIVRPRALVCVDFSWWVGVLLWPDSADVMRFGAIVLSGSVRYKDGGQMRKGGLPMW